MTPTRFRFTPGNLKTSHLYALICGSALLMITGFGIVFLPAFGELDYQTFYQDENGNLLHEPIVFAIGLIVLAIVWMANRRAYVELSGNTLHIHIPKLTGIGLWGQTTGSHRVPLHTIQGMEIEPAKNAKNLGWALNQSSLVLFTAKQAYRLQPYNFRAEGAPDHRLGFRDIISKSQERVCSLLEQAPLTRTLVEVVGEPTFNGEVATSTAEPLSDKFNLLEHKGLLTSLVLLTALGSYALVDYLMLTNFLVLGDMPIWPFLSIGLIAGAIGIQLGRGAPSAEKMGVAAILAAVAVTATYPGLQRYTLLAAPGPETVTYQVADTAYFINDEHPDIDQRNSGIMEFWQQQPTGSQYEFEVYQPAVGFSMVNMEPVYQQSRAFYAAR